MNCAATQIQFCKVYKVRDASQLNFDFVIRKCVRDHGLLGLGSDLSGHRHELAKIDDFRVQILTSPCLQNSFLHTQAL